MVVKKEKKWKWTCLPPPPAQPDETNINLDVVAWTQHTRNIAIIPWLLWRHEAHIHVLGVQESVIDIVIRESNFDSPHQWPDRKFTNNLQV